MKQSLRVSAALAVAAFWLVPISADGAAAPPDTSTIAVTSRDLGGGNRVAVAGDAVIVSSSSDATSATASVAFNFDNKTAGPSASKMSTMNAAESAAAPTVVDLAAKLGMPRAQAEKQFGSLAKNAAARGGPKGARLGGVGAARPMAIGGGTYFGQACQSLSGDQGRLTSYGCSVVYLDWAVSGDWWLAYETSASAASTINRIWQHPFTGFQMVTITPNPGNILVKWAPTGVVYPPTNCTTKTWSVTSPQTGIGYSESGTSCADSIAPVIQWNPYVIYGTHWSGVNFRAGSWEGLNYTHLIHSPYGANPGSFVSLSLWWY